MEKIMKRILLSAALLGIAAPAFCDIDELSRKYDYLAIAEIDRNVDALYKAMYPEDSFLGQLTNFYKLHAATNFLNIKLEKFREVLTSEYIDAGTVPSNIDTTSLDTLVNVMAAVNPSSSDLKARIEVIQGLLDSGNQTGFKASAFFNELTSAKTDLSALEFEAAASMKVVLESYRDELVDMISNMSVVINPITALEEQLENIIEDIVTSIEELPVENEEELKEIVKGDSAGLSEISSVVQDLEGILEDIGEDITEILENLIGEKSAFDTKLASLKEEIIDALPNFSEISFGDIEKKLDFLMKQATYLR
jgi:predicted  nucleic acid-binding Zn-ribbon protein